MAALSRLPGRRLAALACVLLASSLIAFLVVNLLPGDPAAVMLGQNAQPDTVAALRHRLGLDAPLPLRYLHWLGGLLTLDLGRSLAWGVPVSQLLGQRLALTLPLALLTLLLAIAIGIPVGVAAAARQGRVSDVAIMLSAQLFKAIPDFWGGVLLILVFSVFLHWLPSGGFPGWGAPLAALRALILPALALALPQAAILARLTRSTTLSALQEDFVRTARAKGLGRTAALWRHAVPNALVPVVTLLGIQFPLLLTGTIIVENVFNLPGLGRLISQATDQRDLVVVLDLVVLLSAAVAVVNAAVAALGRRLDPRAGEA